MSVRRQRAGKCVWKPSYLTFRLNTTTRGTCQVVCDESLERDFRRVPFWDTATERGSIEPRGLKTQKKRPAALSGRLAFSFLLPQKLLCLKESGTAVCVCSGKARNLLA